MGIKFKNVSYKKNMGKLNLDLKTDQVISVIGDNENIINLFFKLIYGLELPTEGEIAINRSLIDCKTNNKKLVQIRNKIAYLTPNSDEMLFNINILEEIKYGISKQKDIRISEFLQLFNLDENILKKTYTEISDSEKRKICLLSILLKDAPITLLLNPTAYLDTKSKQNLIKYLRKEKRNKKLFIVSSWDSDFLLQVSDEIILFNKTDVTVEKDKYKIFSNEKMMNEFQLNVPWVIKFKNRVLELKKIKLNNRDNVNDLLKDIYRNATKFTK